MSYLDLANRLRQGGVVILDGGTGTELERRGVSMDAAAWCGPATLGNVEILEQIHLDYIHAGADIVTANTYASSRLMLEPAGYADRFEEINRTAVETAKRARDASGKAGIAVAGSLSHMCPHKVGTDLTDHERAPSPAAMKKAFGELATLLADLGCDLLLLEMMYYPKRLPYVFEAALSTGLPVWAGFSARYDDAGRVVSHAPETDIPFEELLSVLDDFDVAAAGVMHTPANVVADAIGILRERHEGPLYAYPDSGYFKMPNWHFEDVIAPAVLRKFADSWVDDGVQGIGGCCGLSPEHIAAVADLKTRFTTA